MKRNLPILLLLACISLTSMTVNAASYITRGGVRYIYNTAKTSVQVTALKDNATYVGAIEVPETITNSDNAVIPVVGVADNAFYGCDLLTSVKLAASVTTIGDYAFRGCEKLQTVEMPGVTKIGNWAFVNCYVLTNLTFSENLTSIGNYAFDKNLAMTSVDLPASVTNLGGFVFEGNPQLVSFTCRALTPPSIKKGYLDGDEIYTLFDDKDYGTRTLYVPAEAIDAYKSALGWAYFTTNIQPLPSAGAELIDAQPSDTQAEYYNLLGARVQTPQAGNIYICRQGSKVSKIIWK